MKTGWMHTKDENGQDVPFAPRTLVDSVQDNDGTPLRDMLGGDIPIDSAVTPGGENAVNSIAVIRYVSDALAAVVDYDKVVF